MRGSGTNAGTVRVLQGQPRGVAPLRTSGAIAFPNRTSEQGRKTPNGDRSDYLKERSPFCGVQGRCSTGCDRPSLCQRRFSTGCDRFPRVLARALHACSINCHAIAAKIRASIVRQPHERQSLFNTGSKSDIEASILFVVELTMNPAAQMLPNLTGKTLSEALTILASQGFQFKTSTAGGYESFEHPDGSIIHIRPTGEVVRTGPKIRGTSGKYYRRRYNQNGEQIEFIPGANTHSTGENMSL